MRYTLIGLLIGVAALSGCSSCSSILPGVTGTNPEAEQAARRYMETVYKKCGDSYYDMDWFFITERKRLSWSVEKESRELTEAERLNRKADGYDPEWEGYIVLRCTVGRRFERNSNRGWGEWQDHFCDSQTLDGEHIPDKQVISKNHGVWMYGYPNRVPLEKVEATMTCQQVPPG